jgi:hypothetical protein
MFITFFGPVATRLVRIGPSLNFFPLCCDDSPQSLIWRGFADSWKLDLWSKLGKIGDRRVLCKSLIFKGYCRKVVNVVVDAKKIDLEKL